MSDRVARGLGRVMRHVGARRGGDAPSAPAAEVAGASDAAAGSDVPASAPTGTPAPPVATTRRSRGLRAVDAEPAARTGLRLFAVLGPGGAHTLAHPAAGMPLGEASPAATSLAGTSLAGGAPGGGSPDVPPGELAETARVPFRDLVAVVAPAPYVVAPLGVAELDAYRTVVEALFATHSLLPAPPGTVFRTREALVEWLELHYFSLVEALNFVDGRCAIRVTALPGDGGPEPRAAALRLTPTSFTAEHEVAGLAEGPDDASRALAAFGVLRRDAVSSVVLRESGDHDAPPRASFLVERRRARAFVEGVAREAARRPGLRLAATGPWPPYDFVRLELRA